MTDRVHRDLLARAYADMQAAVSSAHKLYPGAPAEIIRLATADFLLHVRELRRNGGTPVPPRAEQAGAKAQEIPVVCPECGGAIYDNRQENVERRAKGLKPRPELKCRVCSWVQWPAKPVK